MIRMISASAGLCALARALTIIAPTMVPTGAAAAPQIDLHGYTVAAALSRARAALRAAPPRSVVRFISGQGHHSAGGVSTIKVALSRCFDEWRLKWSWEHGVFAVAIPAAGWTDGRRQQEREVPGAHRPAVQVASREALAPWASDPGWRQPTDPAPLAAFPSLLPSTRSVGAYMDYDTQQRGGGQVQASVHAAEEEAEWPQPGAQNAEDAEKLRSALAASRASDAAEEARKRRWQQKEREEMEAAIAASLQRAEPETQPEPEPQPEQGLNHNQRACTSIEPIDLWEEAAAAERAAAAAARRQQVAAEAESEEMTAELRGMARQISELSTGSRSDFDLDHEQAQQQATADREDRESDSDHWGGAAEFCLDNETRGYEPFIASPTANSAGGGSRVHGETAAQGQGQGPGSTAVVADEALSRVLALGFSQDVAEWALTEAEGDWRRAVELILDRL